MLFGVINELMIDPHASEVRDLLAQAGREQLVRKPFILLVGHNAPYI